jgi:hypothetical protein
MGYLGGGAGDISRVLKIQKRVLRIMDGLDKQELCRPIFKESGILTVTSLYILEVISYIKRHKADLIQNITLRLGSPEKCCSQKFRNAVPSR